MAIQVLRVNYYSVVLDESPSAVAGALARLRESGVTPMEISAFAKGRGKVQLDLVASESSGFARPAAGLGLKASRTETAFLIGGDGALSAAVADVFQRLAAANVPFASLQAMSADGGRFGAVIRVNAGDVEQAARALDVASESALVDETSMESFPASDPPSWAMTHRQ